MADNKQTLNPELKQIYERVMNTPVKPPTPSQPAAPTPTQPATPTPNANASTQTPPPSTPTPPQQQTPPPTQPTTPGNPPATPFQPNPAPTPTDQTTQMQATVTVVPNKTAPNTTPQITPKPLKNNGNPFVVNGQQTSTTQKTDTKAVKKGSKKAIFIVLGVIFLAAYIFFWLIFFGIINKSIFGM